MATFTPAFTAADIAAVDAVLKEVYPSDELEKIFWEDMELLDMFEETTEYTDSNGDRAVLFLHMGRGGAVSARRVGEQLRRPHYQKTRRVEYEYANHYVQVGINGPVVARMKSNRGSAVREIDLEINGGLDDQKRDWVRQLWGAGDAVICGSLPALGVAAQWIPLGTTDPRGLWALERGFIYPGMAIDIGTSGNPTLDTGGNLVTDVDLTPGAPRVKVETATTVTANSQISIYGNRNADGLQRELNGFGNLFGTTTFGGLDPSVAGNYEWQAIIQGNGGVGRNLSISLLTGLLRALRAKGKYPNFLLGDLAQEERYYQLIQGHVQFAGETNLAAGNTEGIKFAKIKSGFVGDPDAIPGKVWMGHTDAIKRFSAGATAWQNTTEGGSILHWLPDYDQFQARAAKYWQVGLIRRNCLGRLDDLNS